MRTYTDLMISEKSLQASKRTEISSNKVLNDIINATEKNLIG